MSSRKCANRSNTKTIISLLRLKIGARKAARLRNYSRATSRPAHFGWWSSSRCGKPRRVQRRAALRESLATTFSIRRPFARARSARSARGASTIPKSRSGILNSQPTGARTALSASFQFRVRPREILAAIPRGPRGQSCPRSGQLFMERLPDVSCAGTGSARSKFFLFSGPEDVLRCSAAFGETKL